MNPLIDKYQSLNLSFPSEGTLEVVFDGPNRNSVTADMHADLGSVWRDIETEPDVDVVLVRGASGAFSSGGDFDMIESAMDDYKVRTRLLRETHDIVYAMLDCTKPIISAVRGPAVGAGLVVALLSDICIASKTALLVDGHTRLGIAAGDHSVIAWPLLCGMSKAKYYLMTCEPMTGEEAERIGLVCESVDDDRVDDRARELAEQMRTGAQDAIRFTKQALNHWYRAFAPAFDFSVAAEIHGLTGPDVREGVASLREKRSPQFGHPSTP